MSWAENYIAGLLRERANARSNQNREAEAAASRELAAYGYRDTKAAGTDVAAEEVTPEDVEQARTAPPKGRTARPRQNAAE